MCERGQCWLEKMKRKKGKKEREREKGIVSQ